MSTKCIQVMDRALKVVLFWVQKAILHSITEWYSSYYFCFYLEVFTEGLVAEGLTFVQDSSNKSEGGISKRSMCKSREAFIGVLTIPLKFKWPY